MEYPSTPAVVTAQPRHRYALLFGNAEYNRNKKIRSCLHDIDILRETLERTLAPEDRFTVYSYKDLTSCEMGALMKEFCDNLCKMHEPDINGQRDIAVMFHYSGHGITIGGASYFVPVDDYSAHNLWLNARTVLNELRRVRAKVCFLTLDCCRTAAMDISSMSNCVSADNLFLVFSTTPGMVASSPNQNGPGYFTKALCNRMLAPKNIGRHYSEMFRSVESEVMEVTKKRQRPSCSGCLSTEFCFVTRPPLRTHASLFQVPAPPVVTLPSSNPVPSAHAICASQPQQQQAPSSWPRLNGLPPQAVTKASVEILAQLLLSSKFVPPDPKAVAAMKKRSKSGNPDKKRSKRGYDIFRSEWFATNKERLGLQGAVGQAERKAGEAWRAMPREEREKYIAKARTDEPSSNSSECPREPTAVATSAEPAATTTEPVAMSAEPVAGAKKRKREPAANSPTSESTYAQLMETAESHISSLLELIPLLEGSLGEQANESAKLETCTSLFQPLIARVQQMALGHKKQQPQPNEPTAARVMEERAIDVESTLIACEQEVTGTISDQDLQTVFHYLE